VCLTKCSLLSSRRKVREGEGGRKKRKGGKWGGFDSCCRSPFVYSSRVSFCPTRFREIGEGGGKRGGGEGQGRESSYLTRSFRRRRRCNLLQQGAGGKKREKKEKKGKGEGGGGEKGTSGRRRRRLRGWLSRFSRTERGGKKEKGGGWGNLWQPPLEGYWWRVPFLPPWSDFGAGGQKKKGERARSRSAVRPLSRPLRNNV